MSTEHPFIYNSLQSFYEIRGIIHTQVNTISLQDELYPPFCSSIFCCYTAEVIRALERRYRRILHPAEITAAFLYKPQEAS